MITTATVASLTSRTELGVFVPAGRVYATTYGDNATDTGAWAGSRWDAFSLASDIRDATPYATMALTEDVHLATGMANATYWVTTEGAYGDETIHAMVSYWYPLHTL